MVPHGCTSKCQPLHVCINETFKDILRNCWKDHTAIIVTTLPKKEQKRGNSKFHSPSRQAIVNWVVEDFSYLNQVTHI